jgi:MFS family permease
LVLLGIFMTSLTSKFWQLVLTQGLLVGLGNSLMFTPAMICVTMAFFKNRGIALGLFVAGSSIGGVIWPIALGRLLRQHGFDWTFRIAGFIMIPLCVISTIMIRMPVMKAGAGPPPKPDLKLLFKNKIYLTFAVGGWFAYMGLFAGLFFIAAYAVHIGINQSLAFYLVSIVNAASLFGRVVPGFLADRWGPLNLFAISAVLSGIITACLTACTTTPGLIIYAVAYGFCSGVSIPCL